MRNHAIHPYSAPVVSLGFLLVAFFTPPSVWSLFVNEHNYAHFNFHVFFHFLISILFVFLGIYWGESFYNRKDHNISCLQGEISLFLISPVAVSVFIVSFSYFVYLFVFHSGFLSLVFNGEGDKAKLMISDGTVRYSSILMLAIPAILWSWYRYFEIRKLPEVNDNFILKILAPTTIFVLYIFLVMASRFALVPLVSGLFLIGMKFLVYDKKNKKDHLKISIRYASIFIFLILVLFSLLAVSRGVSGLHELASMIIGYGPASFNRLALILTGDLVFPFSQTGYYMIPEPLFSLLGALTGGVINGYEVWLSEFSAVAASGLQGNLIWATFFGYSYLPDSLILFSFLFFILFGFVAGVSYQGFIKGQTHGIVLFPLLWFSLFFIFGSNYFVIYFQYFFVFLIIVSIWERICFRFYTVFFD